jgi:hypothetical protein
VPQGCFEVRSAQPVNYVIEEMEGLLNPANKVGLIRSAAQHCLLPCMCWRLPAHASTCWQHGCQLHARHLHCADISSDEP